MNIYFLFQGGEAILFRFPLRLCHRGAQYLFGLRYRGVHFRVFLPGVIRLQANFKPGTEDQSNGTGIWKQAC